MGISDRTEVNLWIIIHRYVDLFLCLCGPSVVGWWVIVRNDFHGLLDEFVPFILKPLTVAVLSGVDTATNVIILWGGRWRTVTIGGHDIVDSQLLADFFDTKTRIVLSETRSK